MTLNSLTPGQWYEVQVWVNDSRALAGGRTVRINGSAFLNHNPGGPSDNLAYEGNTGHHMTGTFRASAASQRLGFRGKRLGANQRPASACDPGGGFAGIRCDAAPPVHAQQLH